MKKNIVWLSAIVCMLFILFGLCLKTAGQTIGDHSEANNDESTQSLIADYLEEYGSESEPAFVDIAGHSEENDNTKNVIDDYSEEHNNEAEPTSVDIASHSETNNNEYTQSIIDDYSEKYGHEFELASVELENQLYGIWQAKEFVGGDNSIRVHWDGFYNDIVIFSEDAWLYGESPHYKPVYALYSADFEELKQNIEWKDNRYEDYTAIVGIAVSSEKNNSMGSTEQRILKFIIMEDHIIIERNGSYFRLEKVGEIELNELFENMKPY